MRVQVATNLTAREASVTLLDVMDELRHAPLVRIASVVAFAVFAPALLAQTLTLTNGVHTYSALTNTTVTLTGRCELRITAASNPIPGCLIHLNSPDAWLLLPSIKPSTVVASYLGQVRVSGVAAVADGNCRVVQFGMGSVVIPQAPAFQPLQVFSGPHFTGASLALSQYVYYKGAGLGALNAAISSFKLRRGYMATFAQNENGTGLSKCYVAQDGDLEVSLLPATFDDSVRFVYVLPWRWVSKKGIAGNIESGLNVQWKYNWNLDQNSTRDLEYVAIRQNRWWPGLDQNWQTRGINHLLGYNEPDSASQANITVGDAIWSWPDLLATGLRVGSPAVTDGGRSGWLYPFIEQADAAGLRVDFVAVHYYWCFNPAAPDGAANQMYTFLKATYDQVQRPLWVTEWNNGANWTGCGDPTYAQQQAAVAKMIEMLDNTPFVERYAIYNWVEDVRRVKWDDGSLTSAGVTYRDKVSPLGYAQELPDPGSRSIAQFNFETNTLDASGFGNNALAFNLPAYTNGWRGQALEFDGTNHFLLLPPNIAHSNAFSFAAWVNWGGGGNWQRIFDFGDDTSRYLFLTPRSGDGTLRFAIKNGGGEQLIQAAALPVGTWTHVAVTLSGSTARLYTNGVLAASSTSFSILPSAFKPSRNYIGESQFVADPLFRGKLDEVLIGDYALTTAQVAALMTNTPPQFTNSVLVGGSAVEGVAYSNNLAGAATDADPGTTLTFSKALGPAWLNVAANGMLSGTPTFADGRTNFFTVRVLDGTGASAFAVLAIPVTVVTANGTWIADASALWSDTTRWSGGVVATGAGRTADFSTINITANRTVALNSSRSIGTLKFGDTSGNQSWTVASSGGSALTLDTGSAAQPSLVVTNTATLSVPLAGTNGFVKSGAGTLVLAASNPLSGPLNLDRGIDGDNHDGITRIAHPGAVAQVNALNIRNTSVSTAGGATLQLDGSAGTIVIAQPVSVSCRNNSTTPTIQNLAGTNTIAGFVGLGVGGSMFNIQSDAGLLEFRGINQYIGNLTGGRIYAFSGVGHCLVSGPIWNSTNGAPISLTKSGSGSLTLAGTNTYAGATTNFAGTLVVNGRIGDGAVWISGGTLSGTGTVLGPVTVSPGAMLSPGDRLGALTVSNSMTLQPGSVTLMEIAKDQATHDQLRVAGILALGGTLSVTNLGGRLVAGDAFRLFQAGAMQGGFAALQLPPLNPGLAWDTNTLGSDGTLRVVSTANPSPTNLLFATDGDALTLSWPEDHIGWRLEVQTNSAGIGLSTNWMEVPGADLTNWMRLPVDPGAPGVFYRMAFP